MGLVTSVTIPGSQFELGRPLQQFDEARVTFEQIVPADNGIFPYIWVYTDDHVAFCQDAQIDPAISEIRLVHQKDNKGLYRVRWSEDTDGFLACLIKTDSVVLEASGTADAWEFELRFDCHTDMSEFQKVCTEHDISMSVDRVITKNVVDMPGQELTLAQRETLRLAIEQGYFEVPRETTLVEMAEQLGVSDQAVSARIRRAMKKLSQQVLLSFDQPEPASPPEQ